jgi:hypothetical protein
MNYVKLRSTLTSALVIAVLAVIHFVAGYALVFTWVKSRSSTIAALVRILVNIWWFPAQQLYQLHPSGHPISTYALPIANSLLWATIVFVIWKARRGQYLRFSVRTLLIVMTLVAALLGLIVYAVRG